MVPDPAAPALGERCAVCHDDISVLRRSNCDHWFCDYCIMVSKLHSPALPPLDCPVCLRPITLLSPAGSSYLMHDDPEIAPILNQIVLYNDCFAGLDDNLIQRCLGDAQDVTMVDGTSQWSAGEGAAEEESTEVTVIVPATETEGITVEVVPPADALISVLSYLPCWADRVHMSSVNRHWRNSLKAVTLQLPPQLPWLLLPSSTEPLFHATMGAATHVLTLPPDIKAHAKFRGSSEGGWFVLDMDDPWPNLLYNINTGDRFELPQQIDYGDEGSEDMILVAAALSAPPSPYIIAAVVKVWGMFFMAFWTPSKKFWVIVDPIPGEDGAELPDILYHSDSGEFWFIGESENIQILSPQVGRSGMIDMTSSTIQVKRRRHYQAEMDMMYGGDEDGIIMRYLVKSRNKILMVQKFANREKPTIRNWMVRVFRFSVDGEGRSFWKDLKSQVPGRLLLFVGRGCSRSFKARHYPGFQNHPKVYFLDDRGVNEHSEDGKSDGFLRDDNGRFSLLNLGNELWPPAGQVSVWSDRQPPIWWLH